MQIRIYLQVYHFIEDLLGLTENYGLSFRPYNDSVQYLSCLLLFFLFVWCSKGL